MKAPSQWHPTFTMSLIGVAIEQEEVKGAVAYVQDFVLNPLFTQRKLFSQTGINIINYCFADSVQITSEFDHWRAIWVEADPVNADPKTGCEKVLLRRKTTKGTLERWFGAESVASSVVGEAAPRKTVGISDAVEVGNVQYVDKHDKVGLSCSSWSKQILEKCKRGDYQLVLWYQTSYFDSQVRLLVVFHWKMLWKKLWETRIEKKWPWCHSVPGFRGIRITILPVYMLKDFEFVVSFSLISIAAAVFCTQKEWVENVSAYRENFQIARHNFFKFRLVFGISIREYLEVVPELLQREY